ncbi:MAG TPA: ABC transporter substrate-binding protein [Acidimicrobiia bacterium]|nr:ABC transporter substrate-binding protein [Acidimicrobiia bacterium]
MSARRLNAAGVVFVSVVMAGGCSGGGSDAIQIGLNLELTGDVPKVGEHSRVAAEMFVEEVNSAGGLDVGGEMRQLELTIEDNGGTAEGAAAAAAKLITQDEVLLLVGPNASVAAVPAGEIANNEATLMISPWSTNPATTLNRPWVFRAPFLDTFQGPVLANFATNEFGAEAACVLYDVASDAPVGQAENFISRWRELHGPDSVMAIETFTTGDRDFSAQLTNVGASGFEVFLVPQYYNEVPLIVEQAHAQGLAMPILGTDAWGDPQLLELCGSDCDGYYFSNHYVASGATGATAEFIEDFKERHGEEPSDVGALTWDSMRLAAQAVQNCGTLTGTLVDDRTCVRDGMAEITDFDGVTGQMSFDEQGDPIKCAVIVRIEDSAVTFHDSVCP